MLKNIKILSLLSLSICIAIFSAHHAIAASKDFSQFDIMFTPVEKNYTTYPAETIENKKIEALQAKDANSMYNLGMMYLNADGVEQDYIQAREWFQKSSNLGNSDSMLALSYLYTLDKRVTKFDRSKRRAKKWIKEAEKSGNTRALYQLGVWHERGIVFQKDYKKAFEYFKKSAKTGDINSYVKLFLYSYHGRGTEVNFKTSIEYLRKIKKESTYEPAREAAKIFLGEIYMDLALRTEKPEVKFKLYELAWAHNKTKAADAIADMYAEGLGVKRNHITAEQWYHKAVKSFESVYSMEKLGLMYLKGPGDVERDYEKAFEMFTRAAELGGVSGAHYLGYMYYYGLGVKKNPEQAELWFGRSKKNASRVQKYGTLDNMSYETDVDKILNQ